MNNMNSKDRLKQRTDVRYYDLSAMSIKDIAEDVVNNQEDGVDQEEYEESRYSIQGITLLSEEELQANRDIVVQKECCQKSSFNYWWLQTPSKNQTDCVAAVYKDGTVQYRNVKDDNWVAPVLLCNFTYYPRGSKIEWAGHFWTVLSETMMLMDDAICRCKFNHTEKEGNDYDDSAVKEFLNEWCNVHKNDTMYLIRKDGRRVEIPNLLEDGSSDMGTIDPDDEEAWEKIRDHMLDLMDLDE